MTDRHDENGYDVDALCFHGSYLRSVDKKGRFNLPFRFRRSGATHAEEKYVVSDGPDGTLNLLPYGEFVQAFNRMRGRRPGAELRRELRRLSHSSRVLSPDAQGRVAVSPDFLARIHVDKKVLVVGMGNYMELWKPERFTATQETDETADTGFMDEFYG